MNELGKIVRPQSPTRTCKISPEDASHIGLILSETKVKDKSGEKLLGMRSNEIVCALSSKTIFLSNSGQVVSNIDLPYYWCNFCTFKTEDKHLLLRHLMEHRFNCQYCIYQTFSRVDVVRHTVKEHSQFDSDNLKFCVLLPDLLKHGMNDFDETSIQQKSPPSLKETEEVQEKQKIQGGKRKKGGKSDQTPSPKKKKGEEEAEKKESVPDNTAIMTPGVCFECCICKFRTFQKTVLAAHNNSEHDRPKPSFSLKVVSRSQAKEIKEMDTKLLTKVKRCRKTDKTPAEPPARRSSPRIRNSANSKENEKEKEEEKESFPPPEVEVDVAAEDDDDVMDGDYQGEDDDEDNDEDYDNDDDNDVDYDAKEENYFVPSFKKWKTSKKKKEAESVSAEKQVKKMYKCLLCPNKVSGEFSTIKKHYIEEHPGGTQVMSEILDDGTPEKFNYFCIGDNCEFQDIEALAWLNHCVLCQKEAMETPNPHNTCHQSVQNTANTVKENLGLLVVHNPDQIESKPVIADLQLSPVKHAVQNIKQEMSDSDNPQNDRDQSVMSVYVYGPAVPENDANQLSNLSPFQNSTPVPSQSVANPQASTSVQNQQDPLSTAKPNSDFMIEQNPDFIDQQDSEFLVQQNQELFARLKSSTNKPARSHNALVNMIQMMKRTPVRSEPPNGMAPENATQKGHDNTSASASSSTVTQASTESTQSPIAASSAKASLGTSSTSISNLSTRTLSSTSATTSISASSRSPRTGSDKDSRKEQSDAEIKRAKILSGQKEQNMSTRKASNDSQSDKNKNSIDNQKSQPNPQGKQPPDLTKDPKSSSTSSNDWTASTSTTSNESKSKSGTSSNEKKSSKKEKNEALFDIDQRGNFKCAHCRFLGIKPLEVRIHMLDKHRMNPLYGLDMMAEVKDLPRFMMFCPKETCKFCTKDKDSFLNHFDTCSMIETDGVKMTMEYKKRAEVTRNFVNRTLQKLLSLTMG